MSSKSLYILTVVSFNIVPSHFYCVNGPRMCPKPSDIESNWDKSLLMPIIEARLDQHQNEDGSSEDFVQLKEIADLVNPVISAFAKGKSMVTDVLADLTLRDLDEDYINCTAPGQYKVTKKPESLPDAGATSEQPKKELEISETVLDKPPSTSSKDGRKTVTRSEEAESSTPAEIGRFFAEEHEENGIKPETTTEFASSVTMPDPKAIEYVTEIDQDTKQTIKENRETNHMQSKMREIENEDDKFDVETVKRLGARVFNEILTAINQ